MKRYILLFLMALGGMQWANADEQCSNNFANAKIINTTINNIIIQCGSEKIDLPVVTIVLPYATDDEQDLIYIARKFNQLRELEGKLIYLEFVIDRGFFDANKGPSVDEASNVGYKKAFAGLAQNMTSVLDSYFGQIEDYQYLYYLKADINTSVREEIDGLNYLSLLFPKKYNSSFLIKSGRRISGGGLARIEFSGFNGGTAFFEILPVEAFGPYLNAYQSILDKLNSGELELQWRDWNKNHLDYDRLEKSEESRSNKVMSTGVNQEKLLNECALIVASRKTIPEVRDYIRDNISDRRYLKVYQASNGWYAISIGTLKPHEEKPVMTKWKASGKIPQDSFCSSGEKLINTVAWE